MVALQSYRVEKNLLIFLNIEICIWKSMFSFICLYLSRNEYHETGKAKQVVYFALSITSKW